MLTVVIVKFALFLRVVILRFVIACAIILLSPQCNDCTK